MSVYPHKEKKKEDLGNLDKITRCHTFYTLNNYRQVNIGLHYSYTIKQYILVAEDV